MRTVIGTALPIVASLLLLLPASSNAQLSEGEIEAICYTSAGLAWLDMEPFSGALGGMGFSKFGDNPFQLEFGMHSLVQKLTFDMSAKGMFWRPLSAQGQEAKVWAGMFLLGLGVNLAASGSSWQLYPYAGGGLGAFKLSIHRESIAFSDALTSPPPAGPFWLPTFVIDAGMGILKTFKVHAGRSLFSLGVKGGYLYDPTRRSEWASRNVAITGGPDPLMTGPYVQVIIGTGKAYSAEKWGNGDYFDF